MFVIPSKETKKFSQPNYGDTQGNLWGTFNVNLTKNTGRVRANRTETVFAETDSNSFSVPVAFAFFDVAGSGSASTVFIAYGQSVFIGGNSPLDSFTLDTLTNSPIQTGDVGDMKVFNNRLYATELSYIKRISPGDTSWTDVTSSLTGSGYHQLCAYKDKLYFQDGINQVYSMNLDETLNTAGVYTLDLSFINGEISWIAPGSNRIWIGITSHDGSHGSIYEWDGQSENIWSKNYIIEAQGSCGCAIWNDTPYVLDIEGRLIAFTGSNFEEVARLPIMQYDSVNTAYAGYTSFKICHFNGIKYINDSIVINVNNSVTDNDGVQGKLENYPSGIYVYTKENGLTHGNSPTITYRNDVTYDYGQNVISTAGAVFDASSSAAVKTDNYSGIMFGCRLYSTDGTNNLSYINVDLLSPKDGDNVHPRLAYIVTPYLETRMVKDIWQNIIIKYRKLLGNTDRILVKYRTTKDNPNIIQSVVWDSDTEFTSSSTVIPLLNIGNEIEVIRGAGSGSLAHIVSIVDNGSDYTVTLDEPIIGVVAGSISNLRSQTWNKLPPIYSGSFQFADIPLPQYNKDTEVQFKIVMNWYDKDNELREVIVVNQTDQYSK